jgi:hypothetical protein
MSGAQGHAGYQDDVFVASFSGPFFIHDQHLFLTWQTKFRDLYLTAFTVLQEGSHKDSPLQLDDAISDFVHNVLTAALVDPRSDFFRRSFFHYIGPALDGEYWLSGIRFAPAMPKDEQPGLLTAERVVCVDQIVNEIDELHAASVGELRAARVATRLSLLLDICLYDSPQANSRSVWVGPMVGEQVSTFTRRPLGFGFTGLEEFRVTQMPKKGELCNLGSYTGRLSSTNYHLAADLNFETEIGYPRIFTSKLLSFPREARRIFRAIDSATPQVIDAFDRSARLYRVAKMVEDTLPSVSLAYRVAAVEALSHAETDKIGFSEFMRRYVKSDSDLDPLLQYLYGTVRSAHFHGGEFPLGEFDLGSAALVNLGPEYLDLANRKFASNRATREAVLNWIIGHLAAVKRGDASTS